MSNNLTAPNTISEDSNPEVTVSETTGASLSRACFNHISNGNFEHTRKALEAYLVEQGVPRQSNTAELVMFMERSFAGKYRKGERSHYQRIMPCDNWRKGDTLAEKLTRCKDKETFKRRFDRIGATAILRRSHFNNFEITNLDFQERLYLRLIDTNQGNVSLFYRNDMAVAKFIQSALQFYNSQVRAKRPAQLRLTMASAKAEGLPRRKAEETGPTNPEVSYLKNPNPLLNTGFGLPKNTKSKQSGDSLTLVKFSSDKKTEKSGQGEFQTKDKLEEEKVAIGSNSTPALVRPKKECGMEAYGLWRQSVMKHGEFRCITEHAPAKTIQQAAAFQKCFVEFFPLDQLPDFFDSLVKEWRFARIHLEKSGVWQRQHLGDYPEIPTLLQHRDKIFTWFNTMESARKKQLQRALQHEALRSQQAILADNHALKSHHTQKPNSVYQGPFVVKTPEPEPEVDGLTPEQIAADMKYLADIAQKSKGYAG